MTIRTISPAAITSESVHRGRLNSPCFGWTALWAPLAGEDALVGEDALAGGDAGGGIDDAGGVLVPAMEPVDFCPNTLKLNFTFWSILDEQHGSMAA